MISIIVPIYNAEKYLKECIDSIINQTYKNIEIVLVDDGSTDKSSEICDLYSKKDTRIKCYHKKNEGLGITRNFGLSKCEGEYVMFLDSDDYISNELIEKLAKEVNENNLDLVKTGFIRFDDSKSHVERNNYVNEEFYTKDKIYNFVERMLGSLPNKSDSIEMGVTASLYRLEIIKKNNIIFPSERKLISEDLIFNIEFNRYAKRIKVIDYLGYYYRYNPKSLSRIYKENRLEMYDYYYLETTKLLKKYDYKEDAYTRFKKTYFINIRQCLQQEKKQISNKSKKEIYLGIKNICNDELLTSIIKSFPVESLKIKQKMFITMLKNKNVRLIYICLKFNLI